MSYLRLSLLCISFSVSAFAMEPPHEDTNWAELVKGQAAIQAAKDFLRQGPNTGSVEFLL
ncbi:hypothetical protein EBU95_17170 [bacterium]|nr:hypothetical protein [bacterium]